MTAPMYSRTLRTRAPWGPILQSLRALDITECPVSTTITPDIVFPTLGLAVLLMSADDDVEQGIVRVERVLGDGVVALVVVFLGSGVWEFQLLLDQRFGEPVYLVPVFTAQDLLGVLRRLKAEYGGGGGGGVATEEEAWTPARMLSLMSTDGGLVSTHSTLLLHSLFPSLRALAAFADAAALEVLDEREACGVLEFLEVEFVVGG